MSIQMEIRRHTLRSLAKMKRNKERVAMLTAYDVMTAQCLDEAGADVLLVGDSLGNVVYGFDSTLPVTLDMMIAHTGAVTRGSKRAMVIADLPFMTYQASIEEALRSAGRCLSEAGAQAVKVEGASTYMVDMIKRLMEAGIPVMGHIGLTPQSVHQMGGFYTHGSTESSYDRLVREAIALEQAGCFSIVLECVKPEVAKEISEKISAITIGIGSGNVCDGEVLVINDVLGYTAGKAPKFATTYANVKETVRDAGLAYVKAVKGIVRGESESKSES